MVAAAAALEVCGRVCHSAGTGRCMQVCMIKHAAGDSHCTLWHSLCTACSTQRCHALRQLLRLLEAWDAHQCCSSRLTASACFLSPASLVCAEASPPANGGTAQLSACHAAPASASSSAAHLRLHCCRAQVALRVEWGWSWMHQVVCPKILQTPA